MKLHFLLLPLLALGTAHSAPVSPGEVSAAMKKATEFMLSISTHGGYLFNYSTDLATRSGEQMASPTQIWIQSPGTPAMGTAFLNAYEATKDPFYLEAARRAAEALVECQMAPSGGWWASGDFDPKYPNTDGAMTFHGAQSQNSKHADNPHFFAATTFDDDTTQGAVRFLMRYLELAKGLDNPRDAKIQASLDRALQSMLNAQYPNGAWPQRYMGKPRNNADYPVIKASFPSEYPKTWPGADYTSYYTLNDNAQRDCIFVMFEAYRRYGKPEYLAAAKRGADFLLLAQLPEPQPGWAQQYDFAMHPVWARVMEIPSVVSMESRSAMQALLDVYLETGDPKYLEPIDRGIAWLQRSQLSPGLWARYYELETNKPIYGNNDGKIYYSVDQARPGYTWQSAFKIPEFLADYEAVKKDGREAWLAAHKSEDEAAEKGKKRAPDAGRVVRQLDDQGRWLTKDHFIKFSEPVDLISTETFIKNLNALSAYLKQNPPSAAAAQ